jgi:Ni,Fe-hydrogenase III component G
MNRTELKQKIEQHWPDAPCRFDEAASACEIQCTRATLAKICGRLFLEWNFSFASLIVEEGASEWQLRYCFYGEREAGWVHVLVNFPLNKPTVPSIVKNVCAVDWHEREAEDLFGLKFEGHPRLGDFILHDDAWQENVEPMRRHFDAKAAMLHRKPDADWHPQRVVEETGAFVMPIGPKFSGITESVHFLLETVGEDVIRSIPRLFYKWRAVEKLAEGKTVDEVLLLAERFAATTAFAHGLAYCQAIEKICAAKIPPRAKTLRVFLAELERLRQHAGAIQEICESTALVVANSQAGILEEDLLRISGELTGHRYLFGLLAPGGLLCDLSNDACANALAQSQKTLKLLDGLEKNLRVSSSFLDRLEEVGFISLPICEKRSLIWVTKISSSTCRVNRKATVTRGCGFCSPKRDNRFASWNKPLQRCKAAASANRFHFARVRRWAGSKLRAVVRFIGCGWTRMDASRAIASLRRRLPTGTASISRSRNSHFRISQSFSPRSICPWLKTTVETT